MRLQRGDMATATVFSDDPVAMAKHWAAQGARRLRAKVKRHAPRCLAVLGITAYRAAFSQPRAALGQQPKPMGSTVVWVLPNPSGLNAHFQIDDLGKLFREVNSAFS